MNPPINSFIPVYLHDLELSYVYLKPDELGKFKSNVIIIIFNFKTSMKYKKNIINSPQKRIKLFNYNMLIIILIKVVEG